MAVLRVPEGRVWVTANGSASVGAGGETRCQRGGGGLNARRRTRYRGYAGSKQTARILYVARRESGLFGADSGPLRLINARRFTTVGQPQRYGARYGGRYGVRY